ncbi:MULTISPECIES: LysR family transcriptional regulator [Alphaproteobacteria]|jgi:DNA-binding transcriptional LysR family regulator|uniref:HTH lysR-type domain-containing protein n=7 Tax=cellular organisms TaxID=131567 RepID=A0A2A2JXB3_9BILA|nr:MULTISPECIES: LysR family transcriptional regulator [Alphaproteobacteria]MBN8845423.1 LysR family transcriptional regulator [Sphingomonadales bacterium]PAV66318.1 hypothetical protein WR25_06517 [Diploscapter pachys]PTT38274.1 LysR family transcriptional regulator [Stenotrophomonas sp. HMWF022]PZU71323.1 MAG: LysR family transcriptional regulator [Rhizobium sp.]HEV7437284.1 LysR family transcriptional regulator [Pseudorhizobium sp.]
MIVKNFGYLIALDQEGHFGRAAKSCNVSQPTLSAGIKQLEQDLGVEIVRHGRRYDGLTSEGETVLAWAKKIESNCEGLERDLSAQKRGLEGQIRLGVLSATSIMASILSLALAERMPLLEQCICTAQTSSLTKALLTHEMDMALVYLEDISEEDFDTHLLYRERIVVFQASGDPLPRQVSWDHVAELPLCILDCALPKAARSRLGHRAAKSIRTNNVDVLAAHIASGRYATVLPQSLATYFARISDIRAVEVAGEGADAAVGLAMPRNGVKSTPTAALFEIVRAPETMASIEAALDLYRQFQPEGG